MPAAKFREETIAAFVMREARPYGGDDPSAAGTGPAVELPLTVPAKLKTGVALAVPG